MTDEPDARLRAALARSIDAVLVLDASGAVVGVGPSAGSLLGRTDEELLGADALELIDAEQAALGREAFAVTRRRQGRHEPVDLILRRGDGSRLPVRAVAVNCLDDPDVRGIVVSLRDMTGIDGFDNAPVARDDRYRQIVELAAEGVWVVDRDLRTTFVTERMASMLGYRPDDMLGRQTYDFIDGDARELADDLAARRRAGISEQVHFRFRHRDGHAVHVRISSVPVLDRDGRFGGAIGMVTDVTSLVEQRERLAADEARHRALLDALPDLVFRLDERGTYLDYHARDLSDLEVPPEEFLGRRVREVLPVTADAAERAIAEAIRTGEVVTYEVLFDAEGQVRTFESRVSAMPNREVIVLVRDVTELRAAEQARRDLAAEIEVRRADEQIRRGLDRQTRLEALGRLAGGVAHDINNLLGVIGNYAAAVERSTTDPRTVQDVEEIGAAVRRGSALTRRLLMFGRRDVSAPEVHDLADLVEESTALLRSSLEPGIRLVVERPAVACPVLVDRHQIGQAVLNLVINAADASPSGGRVVVSVRRVERDGGAPVVALSVADEGEGMPAEVRDRAFEPFFTTKPDSIGTGLGLSIVHGVAVDSGGSVELESRPGEGTVATIRFPVAGADAAGSAEVPVAVDADRTVRVLVVDDDPHALRSAARLLETAGFRVDVATTAAEALARVRDGGDAQVVLTDVVMPGMSGPALAAALRSERPELPVVLMTAYGGDLLPSEFVDVAVLSKPLDPERVRVALLTAVGQPA